MQSNDLPLTELIRGFAERPEPFSRYTAPEFWSDPHISAEMLKWHLNPATDRASYRPEKIAGTVAWLDGLLALADKRVCDLGCGPGLYTTRMHALGANVIGIDVSASSLAYASATAERQGAEIDYRRLDYTTAALPDGTDVFTMISRDFCALSPDQRLTLLKRIRASLADAGVFVFDVSGSADFEAFAEEDRIEADLMEGFWAPSPYVGLKKSFRYPEELVTLDRYLILRQAAAFEVFNWLTYFTRETVERELAAAGFDHVRCFGDFDGTEISGDGPFVVIGS